MTLTVRVLLVGVGNKPAVVLLVQFAVIVVIVVTFIPLTVQNTVLCHTAGYKCILQFSYICTAVKLNLAVFLD